MDSDLEHAIKAATTPWPYNWMMEPQRTTKAGKLRNKKKAVTELLGKSKVCSDKRKTPPRPRIGIPMANQFNEIVGFDLKVLDKKGEYILWIVDMFSKAIKGKHIKDKNPETIVDGLIEKWVIGDGLGPGHPSRGFYSDNGGELLNNTMVNFAATMNINIKMTAADAPWQNGLVERHHATADIIAENPTMSIQTAINHAAFAKNTDVNVSGFSPLQIIMEQNPSFPGLAETTQASSNLDSSSKVMRALRNIDEVRVKYREQDCNEKLKKIRSQRINPGVEKHYEMGDPVIFRDTNRKEWKHGTALVRYGKTLYLKFGNWLRRVPIDTVRPDPIGAEKVEESFIEPNEPDEERFAKEDVPIVDLEQDLVSANERNALLDKVKTLQEELKEEKQNNELLVNEKAVRETEIASENEPKDVIDQKRVERRKKQKQKRMENKLILPTLGQMISIKKHNLDNWKRAQVTGVFKKTSIHKNYKQLTFDDGSRKDVDFENEVEDWKSLNKDEENEEEEDVTTYYLEEIFGVKDKEIYENFPVNLIPRKQYGTVEVQEAMMKEVEKYAIFGAFEEVEDDGQDRVPVKWVVKRHELDGKNQPVKARLRIRGDLEREKDEVRSDSPTVGFVLQRKIFVKPPTEAGLSACIYKVGTSRSVNCLNTTISFHKCVLPILQPNHWSFTFQYKKYLQSKTFILQNDHPICTTCTKLLIFINFIILFKTNPSLDFTSTRY